MTTISPLSQRRGKIGSPSAGRGGGNSSLACSCQAQFIFLAVACLWPLVVVVWFARNAPNGISSIQHERQLVSRTARSVGQNLRFNFRNVVDRVDIVGYGPTHPRVAAVIVGPDADQLILTVESLFRHTDMNRLFCVAVVADGMAENANLVQQLQQMDAGAIPHWHGKRPDIHENNNNKKGGDNNNPEDDEDPHGQKVHVMFQPEAVGVTQARADAVDFIRILQKHHEDVGLKSPQEDLILLLMAGGAQLTARTWLEPVTQALIAPPPILSQSELEEDSSAVAMKLANAVSFNLEGTAKRTGFDTSFTAVISDAPAADINLSSGVSYPTPALNGAAVALRLDTYINLPLQDLTLRDAWTANLDLSLNLWLCADGIDMIQNVDVTSMDTTAAAQSGGPLGPEMVARFAAAWMDHVTAKKFYNAYSKSNSDVLTYLEWLTYMSAARNDADNGSFTKDLPTRCRSFAWYAQDVNPDLSDFLAESEKVVPEEEPRAEAAVVPKKKEENNVVVEEKRALQEENAAAEAAAAAAADDKKNDATEEKQPPAAAAAADGGGAADAADADAAGDDVSIPEQRPDETRPKPAVPLCDECLKIVQQAKPIDITYVDVSGGHKDHPHLGATDESGTTFGYIHDAAALHQNPPTNSFQGDVLRNACLRRDNNYKMLKERVHVDFEGDAAANASKKKRDKIFCLVYTIDSGHPKIPKIRETWGPKCDGFMVGSNKTDPSIGAVNIVHEGREEYNNIWQKVRSMWSYIYDNYYEDYDWFHIGGDDLFLIVENLRLYLESEEIQTAANGGIYLPQGDELVQTPLYLGRRFAYQGDMNEIFNSGGSGYTINKAALKTLVVQGFPKYFPHMHTFSEDTMVARIFRNFGVYPYETKDEQGGERYMPFMPGHHYGYRLPADHTKDWYARYSINIKEGAEHCSPHSVAFHYVKDQAMYRLYALLYNLCPEDTIE